MSSDAIQLYNLFIHGEIDRRAFMEGLQQFATGGLTVAVLAQALMPNYAAGQQVSRTDERIKAGYEIVPSPQGNGSIKGYLVRPVSAETRDAKPAKLPGILVVHENRGLNPHIEDVTRRFALAGFMAFAPDGLTSSGGFPGDDYRGGQMFSKIDGKKMFEDMVAAAFYGGAPAAKEDVAKIKAAILVHHGELDTRLVQAWPAYDAAMKEANVTHEGYVYPGAGHGFHCDATPERYNKAAADLAWGRTVDWFNKHARG